MDSSVFFAGLLIAALGAAALFASGAFFIATSGATAFSAVAGIALEVWGITLIVKGGKDPA